ncbi:Uma2 family endonuclease [Paraliomyxa miuraensis]|uniref:Uma2 family endonuclease n=1 Tax=Paraliomyxa miuraensis TaxID=376150 RepID=UPI0022599005|nr:Uma2 family endonuclease [Paraliomyxa miuraensis]MCX4242586.1 Uma2 family endonuclease [Paraliomyxa miuraensis]
MTSSASKLATVDELFAIAEEDRRHELIEGSIEPKGAASGKHGAAQRKLSGHVEPFDRRTGGRFPGGWWFATEVDVYFDEANTFRPDVVGWRRDRVSAQPEDVLIKERPDWVCEILSTNRRNDLIKKKRVYHRHGVPHYWILDPDEGTLTVYRWTSDAYLEILIAERGEEVRPEPFEALPLRVGALFGDDDEDSVP